MANYGRDPKTDEIGYVNAGSTSYDKAISGKPAYMYAVTVFATAANSYVNIYDTTTTPASPNQPKVEVGEATQYGSRRVVFDPPIRMTSGIYADVTSGAAVVEYR